MKSLVISEPLSDLTFVQVVQKVQVHREPKMSTII